MFSLAGLTFVYSLLLAAIMQAAHTLTRVALSLAMALATIDVLNPSTLLGELASKIGWSVFTCEAVVLLSVLASLLPPAFSSERSLGSFYASLSKTLWGARARSCRKPPSTRQSC